MNIFLNKAIVIGFILLVLSSLGSANVLPKDIQYLINKHKLIPYFISIDANVPKAKLKFFNKHYHYTQLDSKVCYD